MLHDLEIIIKASIIDRHRKLCLNNEFIEFDDKDLIGSSPTRLFKSDITSLRHGVKWINGLQFVIGRIYCIDVKDREQNLIKIRLKSIYGIRKKEIGEKYLQIVKYLYDQYFNSIALEYLEKHDKAEEFEILGVVFIAEGIVLKDNIGLVNWENLETRSYHTYYAIYSKLDPIKYNAFEYLNDWNTGVLYSVSRGILKNKGYWSDT
jgi:hypothetical protein